MNKKKRFDDATASWRDGCIASLSGTAQHCCQLPASPAPPSTSLHRAAHITQPDGTTSIPGATAATDDRPAMRRRQISERDSATRCSSRADADRDAGPTVTVNLNNNLPGARRQHVDSVSRVFRATRAGSRTSDAGGAGLRPGQTVTYTFTATTSGYPCLLQRYPGRPAGRDGPVRRHHRAPVDHPRCLHSGLRRQNHIAQAHWGETDFRLCARCL